MNKMDRQNALLTMLRQHPGCTVQQMSQALEVSQVTIRKDLKQMETEGKLVRSYGKAVLMQGAANGGSSCFIPPESHDDYVKKQQIGLLASSLVQDEDFIFIGPGYTCLEVGINLKKRQRLSVVTTNVSAAIELVAVPEFKLIVTPGDFTKRNGTYYLTGPQTVQFAEGFYVDKMFITADGVSIERGLSVLDQITTQIYHSLKKSGTELIVCVTDNKFSRNALAHLGPLTLASTIVTNAKPDEHYMEYFAANHIRVLYPE